MDAIWQATWTHARGHDRLTGGLASGLTGGVCGWQLWNTQHAQWAEKMWEVFSQTSVLRQVAQRFKHTHIWGKHRCPNPQHKENSNYSQLHSDDNLHFFVQGWNSLMSMGEREKPLWGFFLGGGGWVPRVTLNSPILVAPLITCNVSNFIVICSLMRKSLCGPCLKNS